MSDRLIIGLSGWIIQDGNYGHFSRGNQAAFALEFYPPAGLAAFEPKGMAVPSLTYVGNTRYEASGRVVLVADDWWVVDYGVLAFLDQRPPDNIKAGCWVRGEIELGIDPFFYFERLALRPDAPALIYDWEIVKIEAASGLRKTDSDQLAWKELINTHDDPLADYLLHCRRLDSSPRRDQSSGKP
jgi:hypothetical protein